MKPKSFMIYAHGRKVHARLIKHDHKPSIDERVCWQCQRNGASQFVAEAVQYSFVADMHWEVYNCELCGVNTCHQYEVELTLKQQLDCLK